MTKFKTPIIIFILIVINALVLAFLNKPNSPHIRDELDKLTIQKKPMSTVEFNSAIVYVEIVRSTSEIEKGLGGRDSLQESQGMLFDFGYEDTFPTFWMKGMRFPIDIIWINDDKVVDITKNAQPPDSSLGNPKLPLYRPRTPVDLILEVNAGFSDDNSIQVGNSVVIRKI